MWDKVFGTHKPFAVRGAEGDSAAEQQRRRASFKQSAVTSARPAATTLGSAAEAGTVGPATRAFTPLVAQTSCTTTATAAVAAIAAAAKPPARKPAPSRSSSPSMRLGSGASSSGESPQLGETSNGAVPAPTAAPTDETDEQSALKTAEVVARLEGLLRVRSPTQTSKRLAKLAAIDLYAEDSGETHVLMRGLVVALTYGALFVGLCVAP